MTGSDFHISPSFLPLLREHGLDSFEKIMALPSVHIVRSVPGRSTGRVQIGSLTVYLKRYEPQYLSPMEKLRRLAGLSDDEAMHEWRMIHELRARGFNTATPVAAGQHKRGGIVARSFVMTEEIAGGLPAVDYMRTLDPKPRRQFVLMLANLTQRFHTAGFIHKDYYLHQIFVVERDGQSELFLLDLQRVLGPRRFRRRWLAKDLGALGYSAQLAGASQTDLLRFYKRYADKARLDPSDKQFIGAVARRIAHLHQRGPKHGEIWDRPR